MGPTSSERFCSRSRSKHSPSYGEVIKRTGMGEVPEPPTTGFAPLSMLLQPEMLRTVMLISPGVGGPGLGSIWLMKACMKPTTVTAPGLTGKVLGAMLVSIIGMVTIELEVVTRFPV
jgi:hypothetical protein